MYCTFYAYTTTVLDIYNSHVHILYNVQFVIYVSVLARLNLEMLDI